MPDMSLVDRIAEAAFEADCLAHGHVPNFGRSTPEKPRGFKTEIMVWQQVARAALAVMEEEMAALRGEVVELEERVLDLHYQLDGYH